LDGKESYLKYISFPWHPMATVQQFKHFLPHGQLYVVLSTAFSFDNVGIGVIVGHRQRVENDSIIASHMVYWEVPQSFGNVNKLLSVKYLIAPMC
jgi:hypothetical protein